MSPNCPVWLHGAPNVTKIAPNGIVMLGKVFYGPVYSCMIPLKSRMVQYYSTLPYLVLYSPIWSHVRPFLFLFCPVWPHMILYSTVLLGLVSMVMFFFGKNGQIWLSMAQYDQVFMVWPLWPIFDQHVPVWLYMVLYGPVCF